MYINCISTSYIYIKCIYIKCIYLSYANMKCIYMSYIYMSCVYVILIHVMYIYVMYIDDIYIYMTYIAEWWFLRREMHYTGAARLQLPLSAVTVGALVSCRRLLHLSCRNHTLDSILCILYVEAEHYLCVERGSRSCLEVCLVDVICKFQISVWCSMNKVPSSSVIQFHRHYSVVSVTLDSVVGILSMQC